MFRIGPHQIDSRVVLAPMAGVTDRPFRQLCRRFGAGLAVSEMVTGDARLWDSRKSRLRLNHQGEAAPRSVQIAGAEPAMLAEAARLNADMGADIIDINMGCPAKKVCRRAAGSALLRDERLVSDILRAVVQAVDIPVTLKIRTGWAPEQRNGVTVARIAEDAGIAALAVHGRTRACRFEGAAEYDTIAAIVDAVSIPVMANGDIDSPQKARRVLDHTGAQAVMIGRAAQGQPWLIAQIDHFLRTGEQLAAPGLLEQRQLLLGHLDALYQFYGEAQGLRIARKHVGWYLSRQPGGDSLRREFNHLTDAPAQQAVLARHFDHLLFPEVSAA